MAEKVLYDKRERIAHVTINRPEAKNAIDPDVHHLMIEIWQDFATTTPSTWPSSPEPATPSAPGPT